MPGQVSFRGIYVTSLTVVWALALSVPANSQSTPTLQGSVVDPAGAIVAGAIVTVRHQATGLEQTHCQEAVCRHMPLPSNREDYRRTPCTQAVSNHPTTHAPNRDA